MPNDNNILPVNGNKQKPIADAVPPVIPVDDAPPPMIHDDIIMGSSVAPVNDIQTPPVVDTVMPPMVTEPNFPKKKFAGRKIIATILGLFLLVGGVGAGVYLTQQNQNPNEKAECAPNPDITYANCGDGIAQVTEQPNLQPGETETCWQGVCTVYANGGVVGEYRIVGSDGGGAGGCWEGKVDCPPGTVINTGQPVNVFCSRNEASAAKPICSTGTAQRQTDVCCGGEDKDGEGTCGNPQYITYNCCPVDSPPVCTDATSRYTKTVLYPGGPTGACWEFDQFGQFRRDTYVSHTDTNCGPRPGRDEETGEKNYGCDYIVTCERKVTTCVCGTNTPPPTPAPTAFCQNVKAYSGANFVLLTPESISMIQEGDPLHFCVTGSATGGSFDKAKFTINEVVQPETTLIRPGSTDFCQSYTVPAGVTTFNVTAQIHHITLGWK